MIKVILHTIENSAVGEERALVHRAMSDAPAWLLKRSRPPALGPSGLRRPYPTKTLLRNDSDPTPRVCMDLETDRRYVGRLCALSSGGRGLPRARNRSHHVCPRREDDRDRSLGCPTCRRGPRKRVSTDIG